MKNLTTNQQELIANITAEFMKINESSNKLGTFNLIDIKPLFDKNKEIEDNKKIIEADAKLWKDMAMDEAERIARLLQEDLPFICVERFGESNGHYDLPSICIQREEGLSGHHEGWVQIEVVVNKEIAELSHGCTYSKGIGLGYKADYDDKTIYNSIEELFELSSTKEMIRTKILNKIK